MIFTAENTTAGNGRRIKSTVELIGSDDERPSWRTEVAVNGDTLYRSHHHTKRGAAITYVVAVEVALIVVGIAVALGWRI